jgi:hypothetical protein
MPERRRAGKPMRPRANEAGEGCALPDLQPIAAQYPRERRASLR